MPPSSAVTPARILLCALALFAGCAKSVGSDLPAQQNITDPDADAGATNELGGASTGGSSGSNSAGGSVEPSGGSNAAGSSAAGANAMGGAASGNGGTANGGTANGGTAGSSAGAGNSAGKGGTGNSAGSANSAGSSSAGATGSAGSAATSHVCKSTIDLNGYTTSKAGCGGYTTCKGQIHFKNDEAQALTLISISFSVASGISCTADHAPTKWTITDDGKTSKHCVFSASGAAWMLGSGATFGFGYDTTQSNATAPSDITISDPSCSG